jgi:hypothetical protein
MEERTCPTCNISLEIDDIYDGFIGINEREEEWFGHCPQCCQKYHWTEVYVYKETKDFEVCVKEED